MRSATMLIAGVGALAALYFVASGGSSGGSSQNPNVPQVPGLGLPWPRGQFLAAWRGATVFGVTAAGLPQGLLGDAAWFATKTPPAGLPGAMGTLDEAFLSSAPQFYVAELAIPLGMVSVAGLALSTTPIPGFRKVV